METLSIIRLFYIMYTVYTLFVVSVSDYQILHAFFGLLAIWLVYLAFGIGYKTVKPKTEQVLAQKSQPEALFLKISAWKGRTYVLHVLLCWICTFGASAFYTGKNVLQVLAALAKGESLYASYQRYFAENSIGAFSFSKIIFILMLTYTTAILFYSFASILLSKTKITVGKVLFLFLIGGAYLYFGISRGTNFEMYMIFMLLSYCILNRHAARGGGHKKSKTVIVVAVLGVIMIFAFRIVLTVRGSVFKNTICPEIAFDPDSVVATVFPTVTNIGLSVFSYLGYGIYTIGVTVADIFLKSFPNFLAMLAPGGYALLCGQSLAAALEETIYVGVHWIPDWINFVGLLGLPLFLMVFFLFGRITARILSSGLPRILVNVCCIFVFLQMISIPIGNFIFTSTPNILCVILTIGLCVLYKTILLLFNIKAKN